MTERYRFGGPIPESVQRLKSRRVARAITPAHIKPVGVDALGMLIFPRGATSGAMQSRPSPTADGSPQP